MAEAYRVVTGLSYGTDPEVIEALREMGRQAAEALMRAHETRDPRDVDAAHTADQARAHAVADAMAAGHLKRVEAGAVVTDLPADSIPWLLEDKHIVLDADEPMVLADPVPDVVEQPTADDVWQDLGRPAEGEA